MSTFVPFTAEEKLRAAHTDLPTFLQSHGVELKCAGREYALANDSYIRINGNKWFDHGAQQGGGAVKFVEQQFGLSYIEAVGFLLHGDVAPQGLTANGTRRILPPAQKAFSLPPASRTMKRAFAYLSKERQIPTEIISYFVKAKLLYESKEPSKKRQADASIGSKIYHNIIFVGRDKDGNPRHASRHGTYSATPSFKGNAAGSDPAYSFHHIGKSNSIFVFEASIDLLSYITLNPLDWEKHSYVALCGVAEHALLQCLADNPHINEVSLCLDNDERGRAATQRLERILQEHGYESISVSLPQHKDWNDDLREQNAAAQENEPCEQPDWFAEEQSM